ncbi:Beta-galactosidase C-terminal domain, partial [Isoptericola sp. NPDC060257]|uniref:Beta-galactosidase C-terminal domain n=1 Tax=Isoptericola sp. NPDC060257 TaxID=3347087 RepID=UPI0036645236
VPRVLDAAPGLEAVRRRGDDRSYLFLLNHTGDEQKVAAAGHDLLSGAEVGPLTTVPAGGARVLREPRRPASG